MRDRFRRFSNLASGVAGSVGAFLVALLIVAVWAITGPLFGFSDTWQLVINTGTTIVTFLMVFLIQNTQNRDSQAIHAKLNELVVNLTGADNQLVRAEDLAEEELSDLKEHFEELADATGIKRPGHKRAGAKRRRVVSSKRNRRRPAASAK